MQTLPTYPILSNPRATAHSLVTLFFANILCDYNFINYCWNSMFRHLIQAAQAELTEVDTSYLAFNAISCSHQTFDDHMEPALYDAMLDACHSSSISEEVDKTLAKRIRYHLLHYLLQG